MGEKEYWVNLYLEDGDLKVSPHYSSYASAIYHRGLISRQYYGEPFHVILANKELNLKPIPIGATGKGVKEDSAAPDRI